MKAKKEHVFIHLRCRARLDGPTEDDCSVRINRKRLTVRVRVLRSRKRMWSFPLADLLTIGVTRAIKAQCERAMAARR